MDKINIVSKFKCYKSTVKGTLYDTINVFGNQEFSKNISKIEKYNKKR